MARRWSISRLGTVAVVALTLASLPAPPVRAGDVNCEAAPLRPFPRRDGLLVGAGYAFCQDEQPIRRCGWR